MSLWVDLVRNPEALAEAGVEVGALLELEAYDHEGRAQGTYLGEVVGMGQLNGRGLFLTLRHIAASDPYYHWYAAAENAGQPGAAAAVVQHHLCRGLRHACRAEAAGAEIVHSQAFRLLNRAAAQRLIASWGFDAAALLPGPAPRARARGPRAAPALPALPPPPPPPGAAPFIDVDADAATEVGAEEPAPAAPAVRGKRKRPAAELDDEGLAPAPEREAGGVLDKELRALLAEDSGRDTALRSKLADVRARMEGQGKRRKPADVLLERARRSGSASAEAEAPAPSASRPSKLARALAAALRGDDGGGDEEDSDSEGDLLAVRRSNIKREAFRRLARKHPGRLLINGLSQLRTQVMSEVGSVPEDELAPIVFRYLVTVFLPNHPVKRIGEAAFRELRTLAESIDGLLRGDTLAVLDLLMQHFKAHTMALRDGGWDAARWLLLLPPEAIGSATSPDEEEIVRRIESGELRLKDLLKRSGGAAG